MSDSEPMKDLQELRQQIQTNLSGHLQHTPLGIVAHTAYDFRISVPTTRTGHHLVLQVDAESETGGNSVTVFDAEDGQGTEAWDALATFQTEDDNVHEREQLAAAVAGYLEGYNNGQL